MNYFNVNYDKLKNLKQINYHFVIVIILIAFLIMLFIASHIDIYHKKEFYGIYENNMLKIKINSKLSDELNNNQYIKFKNINTKYKIINYGNYEIINQEIYQEIALDVQEKFMNNEIGLIEFRYNKQNILKYIFELFK